MPGQPKKTARLVAAEVLNQLNMKISYAGPILNKLARQSAEKQRATDLVYGTIRNRRAIDAVIKKLADCRTERISFRVLNIIRVGVYELLYCPQMPQHAIVNEAVENAKAISVGKQTGFINAVLRQVTRQIKNRQADLAKSEHASTLPQDPSMGCQFHAEILPDPTDSPVGYLSAAFSLPKWLIEDWVDAFGLEKAKEICFGSNRKPGIYLRANILHTTSENLVNLFKSKGIQAELKEGAIIKIKSPAAINKLPGYEQGLFSVQDITASKPVRLLNPRADWRVLDLCAAPGGKVTQLAELTLDKATIIATDIDTKRLEFVKENLKRLGIKNVTVMKYTALEKTAADAGPFDCVLLDVPCSNTGVLARRPEVRYRVTQKAIEKLVRVQKELLNKAVNLIKPGGIICYSTCSIQKAENSELVKGFQKDYPFRLEAELLTLPSAEMDCDGGYAAILVNSAQP